MLIWRNHQLAISETFIRAQARAMTRWKPYLGGLSFRAGAALEQPVIDLGGSGPLAAVDRRLAIRAGASPRLMRALRGNRIGLLHAHFLPDAGPVARTARLTGRPLVVTAHGYDVTSSLVTPGQLEPALRTAARFVAVSDFIAGRLVDLGAPASRVVVLPIGIAVPPDVQPTTRPRILFVGRLVEKKGPSDLLDAVALLPEPLRRTPVTIVGDGPLGNGLRHQAATLGLNVTFRGALAPDAVQDEMRDATVFCVPSKRASTGDAEGFGMVFLEAAALRLPVVTYTSGGTPEAVRDGITGLLCPEGDTRALSAALGQVLAEPAFGHALGSAGRARVVRDFDITDRTAALEDLYDRVVAQPPTRRWA